MSVVDEIIARLERQQAANTLRGVRNESELICPHCRYQGPESEFDYADDSSDDSDKWRTDDEAAETGGDDPDNSGNDDSLLDMHKNPKTPQDILAESLIQAANKNMRPAAQRAQQEPKGVKLPAPNNKLTPAEILAQELAKIYGEKR